MLDLLTDVNAWAALLTLSALEIVLGIDNLVFIAILTAPLDRRHARQARAVGLSLAFVFRVLLLASLSFIMGLTRPVITFYGAAFSWRDIILIAGGLFLIAKATHEIHGKWSRARRSTAAARTAARYGRSSHSSPSSTWSSRSTRSSPPSASPISSR